MTHIPGVRGRTITEMLKPQGACRQPMDGFDPDYADIVDYIIRCTHRIWEEKNVGLIDTHYSEDCIVHLMSGPACGVAAVREATLSTLAAFPDRTLIGESVIWSEVAPNRYLSSHRISSAGTHLGDADFGPATGRRTRFTTIADCLCEKNRIIEEWLVRDTSAQLLGLGIRPLSIAQAQADNDRKTGFGPQPWRQELIATLSSVNRAPPSQGTLPSPDTEPDLFAREVFDRLWNGNQLALVRDIYCPAARWYGPSARRLFGHGEIVGWLVAMQSTFVDGHLNVENVAWQQADEALDISVRWSFTGIHRGGALYGAPTGIPVYVLAVTHWRLRERHIVEETTIFDEVALLRQIEGGL